MSETVICKDYLFFPPWQGQAGGTRASDAIPAPRRPRNAPAVTASGSRVPAFCRWLILVPVLLFAGIPGRAAAQFFVCNQSFDVSNLAIGQFTGEDFETTGWWTIGPNQCATVIDEPLASRFVYVFAQDVFGRVILSGSAPMCVAAGRFRIQGSEDCIIRGFIEARFREVDTRQSEQWTLFLYPP